MKQAACALLLALGISGTAFADTDTKEIEGIKKVIQTAYVDGILNLGKVSDIKKGFHPDFALLYVRENQLGKLTRDRWLQKIEQVKKEKTISRRHESLSRVSPRRCRWRYGDGEVRDSEGLEARLHGLFDTPEVRRRLEDRLKDFASP